MTHLKQKLKKVIWSTMKRFNDIRHSLNENKKMNISGVKVEIVKDKNKFKVMVDGSLLDSYPTENQAVKMAKEFVKQYKG
jgi:hypothetical protein